MVTYVVASKSNQPYLAEVGHYTQTFSLNPFLFCVVPTTWRIP